MQKVIFIYVIFINIAAFVVYSIDKARAKAGASRISERELFTFSLLGGFLGATLSMALFHHKISKNSFLLKHILILVIWISLLVYYFGFFNQLNFIR